MRLKLVSERKLSLYADNKTGRVSSPVCFSAMVNRIDVGKPESPFKARFVLPEGVR